MSFFIESVDTTLGSGSFVRRDYSLVRNWSKLWVAWLDKWGNLERVMCQQCLFMWPVDFPLSSYAWEYMKGAGKAKGRSTVITGIFSDHCTIIKYIGILICFRFFLHILFSSKCISITSQLERCRYKLPSGGGRLLWIRLVKSEETSELWRLTGLRFVGCPKNEPFSLKV